MDAVNAVKLESMICCWWQLFNTMADASGAWLETKNVYIKNELYLNKHNKDGNFNDKQENIVHILESRNGGDI